MSAVKFLLPQIDELKATDTLALQESKTVFPFNLSAKNIKVSPDMELAEKYPFSIETTTGFTYQIVKDGKKIAEIQLSDQKGLDITGDAKTEKLLKYFFMDETRVLYRSLINQLTKLGNNQLFILCLGMNAQRLVQGDVLTVSMIKAPTLKVITGDKWIELVIETIKDIAWGFFSPQDRLTIADNFERELKSVIDIELKLLGVNIPQLEKEVKRTLKQITEGITESSSTLPETGVTMDSEVIDDTPESPFVTEQTIESADFDYLLKIIQNKSRTVAEFIEHKKFKSKSQLVKMLRDRKWIITDAETPNNVEAETTESEEVEQPT